MRLTLLRVGGGIAAVALLASNSTGRERAQESRPTLVRVEGLEPAFSSCSIVKFSLQNISRQEIYVEAYPEDLGAATWNDVGCPYDLNDPPSRVIKRILTNPRMMKPGSSVAVSYDRCSDYEWCVKPKFGKHDKRAFRRALQQEDAKAISPVTQRIRVEAYVRVKEQLERASIVWSEPFIRVAADK